MYFCYLLSRDTSIFLGRLVSEKDFALLLLVVFSYLSFKVCNNEFLFSPFAYFVVKVSITFVWFF